MPASRTGGAPRAGPSLIIAALDHRRPSGRPPTGAAPRIFKVRR
jgi:hypothetical protein